MKQAHSRVVNKGVSPFAYLDLLPELKRLVVERCGSGDRARLRTTCRQAQADDPYFIVPATFTLAVCPAPIVDAFLLQYFPAGVASATATTLQWLEQMADAGYRRHDKDDVTFTCCTSYGHAPWQTRSVQYQRHDWCFHFRLEYRNGRGPTVDSGYETIDLTIVEKTNTPLQALWDRYRYALKCFDLDINDLQVIRSESRASGRICFFSWNTHVS
jgi:hypothetical protein